MYPDLCASNLTCDRNTTCKISLEQNCVNNKANCATGLGCNNITNKCDHVLPPRYPCNITTNSDAQGRVCTSNTVCKNGICFCDNSSRFIHHDAGTEVCQNRILPGESCSFAFAEHPCVTGAKCDSGVCSCVTDDHYVQVNNSCVQYLKHGETGCNRTNLPCVPHADCLNDQCFCNTTHYFDGHDALCELRKPGDGISSCSLNPECVPMAECSSIGKVCKCLSEYYNSGNRCEKRLAWGNICETGIKDQCLFYGECTGGHCRCSHGNFKHSNRSCFPPINYNNSCDLFNTEPQQCGNGTHCVFRRTDMSPLCACDLDHYFNGERCVLRIRVGHPCTYTSHSDFPLGETQCVTNAGCDYNTTHVCVCDAHYYVRQGLCPSKVPYGQTCDPWDDSDDQCESGTCTHGRCL